MSPMTTWLSDQPSSLSSSRWGSPRPRKSSIPLQALALPVPWGSPLWGSEAGTVSFPPCSHFSPRVSLNDTLGTIWSTFRNHSKSLLSIDRPGPGAGGSGRVRTRLSKRGRQPLIWKVRQTPSWLVCSRSSPKLQITLLSNHKSKTSW